MYPQVTQFETRERLARERIGVRAAIAARLAGVRARRRSARAAAAAARRYAH